MNSKNQVILLAILLVLTVSQSNPFCSQTDNSSVCTDCYFGYYLNSSKICVAGNAHCASFTNDGTGHCATCWSSSFAGLLCAVVSNNPTPASDPNCANVSSNVCVACYQGYYLNAANSCILGNNNCATLLSPSGLCGSCHSGYVLNAGSTDCIVPAVSNDPNCANVSSNVCVACYQGYYLNAANSCILGNNNCATLLSPSGLCESCHSGYVLNAGSTDCIVPAVSNDPYCTIHNTLNVCTACAGGYYLNTLNVCKVANPLCASIATAPSNGNCLSCYAGYYLASSGLCAVGDPYCKGYIGAVCSSCYYPLQVSTVDPTRCVIV